MMRRYVVPPITLTLAGESVEFWLGIEADEDRDLSGEWGDLLPADGMTDDELSVVRRWIAV